MNWIYFSIGKCYYKINDVKNSFRYLNINLKICRDPRSHFHSWYFKALNHEKLGNKQKVLDCLKKVVSYKAFFKAYEIPEELSLLKKYMPDSIGKFWHNAGIQDKLSCSSAQNHDNSGVPKPRQNPRNAKLILNAFCYQPFYEIVIDMYGGTAPCCIPDKGNQSANVAYQGLSEIWRGEYFTELRKKALTGKIDIFCNKCSLQSRTEAMRQALKSVLL
jgi:tetratricopeptide (TPR) repeat protein